MSPNRQNYFRQKIAEMEKHRTFGLSNTSNYRRGRQKLAPKKAGFFRFSNEETALFTCRGMSIMGIPTRAERLVFDSGKGITLFLCPKLTIEHHAQFHTNTRTSRSTSATLRATGNAIRRSKSAGSRTASPGFQIHGAVNSDSGRTPRTFAGNPANAERRVPGVKSTRFSFNYFQPSARRLG